MSSSDNSTTSSSTLECLKRARLELNSLKRGDYCEIASFQKPPAKVHIIFTLVMILLGKEGTFTSEGCYEWNVMKKEIHSLEFPAQLQKIEVVSKETLDKVNEFAKDRRDLLTRSTYAPISLVAERMCGWASAVLDHSTANQ